MEHTTKIGITGGHGFLGKNLVSKLSAKHYFVSFQERTTSDLLKPETLKKFVQNKNCIVHLAAYHGTDVQQLFTINVLGTLSLLEAIKKYGATPHIIFTSSAQVYLRESMFGLSKKIAEELITYYAKQGYITATILRISNIYGPGGKPQYNSVIATFSDNIRHDKPIVINGNGSQKRDFVFVTDVVDALIKSIHHTPEQTRTIDICTGKRESLNKVLDYLRLLTKKTISVTYTSMKNLPASFPKKSNEKAYKELQWKPKVDLKKGLSLVIEN
jgi:nucleoside-diphosphate-sugar epimerase